MGFKVGKLALCEMETLPLGGAIALTAPIPICVCMWVGNPC